MAAASNSEPPQNGRLTIYLGSAAGVGKTYKMLQDAHVVREQGLDVVIGWVDTHGRKETYDQIQDLEIIPPKRVPYQGREYAEMDNQAILQRAPQIALVDELAHSNVPESGANSKRYEDIIDLLDAGIDVVTTVNIQHIESLYDTVAHMTGVYVRERVPDSFVSRARELKLVDVSPETLQERLLQGKIYDPDKIELALTHFFQLGRLAALRELALVEVADTVTQEGTRGNDNRQESEVRERILVCVSEGRKAERLIRRGWRIADRRGADLFVLMVVSAKESDQDQREIARTRQFSEQFHAQVLVRTAEPRRIGEIIVGVAKELAVSQIVIGVPSTPSTGLWHRYSPVDYVLSHAEFVDLHVVGNQSSPQSAESIR